jgi:O-methyltransferase
MRMANSAGERLKARLQQEVPRLQGRALRPLLRGRRMRHSPFDEDTHRQMAADYDYYRLATLALAVKRVESEAIPGSFAEVGVWRGDTSRLIHGLAPDRRYYLFDTFEGFPESDLEPGWGEDKRFRDTGVDRVLDRVGRSPNVVAKPGYVPATFDGLEHERFAFVLLDLDLYDPTVASLEFFYPRLEPGAFLFVHDYNNVESNWACKRALDSFLAGKGERVVETADVWGSALFRKQ